MKKYKYEIGIDFEDENKFDNSRYLEILSVVFLFRFYTIVCLAGAIFSMFPRPVKIFQIIFICEMFFISWLCHWGLKKPIFQKTIDLHRRLSQVPKYKIRNAKIAYGKEWRPAVVECHEAHINGDCLICGAD